MPSRANEMSHADPTDLDRPALVFLRGQGEASWRSHHAPDCNLTETAAGLECRLRDAWHECSRQGRRGLLLLGSADDLSLGVAGLRREDVAVVGIDQAAAHLATTEGPVLVTGPLDAGASAQAVAAELLELQLWPQPGAGTRRGTEARPPDPELVSLPGSRFRMGTDDDPDRWDDESPAREVDVGPFRLARQMVTNAGFSRFLAARPEEPLPAYHADPRFNAPDQPVVGVARAQAERCAAWMGLRLPTEMEWEYACRAGTTGPRYGSLDDVAWHGGNSGGRLHPVGGRTPNAFGLHDMLGNAWEWVATSDAGPILRGGSWADNARTVRATTRLGGHPGPRVGNIGFRLATSG